MNRVLTLSIILTLIIIISPYVTAQTNEELVIGTWEGVGVSNSAFADEPITANMTVTFEEDGSCTIDPDDDKPGYGTYSIGEDGKIALVVAPPYDEYKGSYHQQIEFSGTIDKDSGELVLNSRIEVSKQEYNELKKLYIESGMENELPAREEMTTTVKITLQKSVGE